MADQKSPAGSATGFDLAELTRYDFFETDDDDELRVEPTGRWVRFEDVEALARATPQHPDALSNAEFLSKRLARVAKLAGAHIPEHFTHEQVAEVAGTILGSIAQNLEKAATPQHSVTEHEAFKAAMVAKHYVGSMFDYFLAEGEITYHDPVANQMYDAWQAGRAQPLASTAATQPEQASIKTWQERAGLSAHISASQCTDVSEEMEAEIADLRAALAIPASTAPTEPVCLSEEHPNLKVPIDPACSAKLDELGDDRGQGLDPYWKFGFRTGWHHGVRSLMASTAASEQQASVSELPPLPQCDARISGERLFNESTLLEYAQRYARAALSGRATIPSEADERAYIPQWHTMLSADRNYTDPRTKREEAMCAEIAELRRALTPRATTADEQAMHLTDEGHQAAIASFMATPGFKEAFAELAADQQGAAQAQAGESRKAAIHAVIDHISDNWPMKKYTLEEIEIRLRAEIAAMAAPATGSKA